MKNNKVGLNPYVSSRLIICIFMYINTSNLTYFIAKNDLNPN